MFRDVREAFERCPIFSNEPELRRYEAILAHPRHETTKNRLGTTLPSKTGVSIFSPEARNALRSEARSVPTGTTPLQTNSLIDDWVRSVQHPLFKDDVVLAAKAKVFDIALVAGRHPSPPARTPRRHPKRSATRREPTTQQQAAGCDTSPATIPTLPSPPRIPTPVDARSATTRTTSAMKKFATVGPKVPSHKCKNTRTLQQPSLTADELFRIRLHLH